MNHYYVAKTHKKNDTLVINQRNIPLSYNCLLAILNMYPEIKIVELNGKRIPIEEFEKEVREHRL